MYTSTTSAVRVPLAWLASFALMVAFVLGGAASALAGEGGNPANQRSIFEIVASERAEPSAETTVVPAAAPNPSRWHDKSEAEWRAYHRRDRAWKARNAGR